MQTDLLFVVKRDKVVAGFWVDSDGQIEVLMKWPMGSCLDSRLPSCFFTACPAFLIPRSIMSHKHKFIVALTPFFFAS